MRETWCNHTWREPKLAIDGNTTPDVIELTPKGEEQRFTRRTRLYVYVDGYSSLYRKRNAEFVSREKNNNNNTLKDQNYYSFYSFVLQTQQQSHNYHGQYSMLLRMLRTILQFGIPCLWMWWTSTYHMSLIGWKTKNCRDARLKTFFSKYLSGTRLKDMPRIIY